MDEWDWDDSDWDDPAAPSGPNRAGLALVAVIVLVPFVYLFAGGANAIDALGPGLLAVVLFFAAVAAAFARVRRWLRRRLLDDRTVWSDRR